MPGEVAADKSTRHEMSTHGGYTCSAEVGTRTAFRVAAVVPACGGYGILTHLSERPWTQAIVRRNERWRSRI